MSALRVVDRPDRQSHADLEEVPCNLCGSWEQQVLFDAGADGRVVRCELCGLGFVSPRPIDVTAQYEGEGYFGSAEATTAATRGSPAPRGYDAYLEDREALRPYFNSLLDEIERRRDGARGRLLEVGCAAGFLLAEARERGHEVAGLEPSPWASAIAREQLGLSVETGLLGQVPLQAGGWDIVVALQTIEHVPDPASTVAELLRLLRPGGLLLLTTPDERSWLHTLMGRRWIAYKPPEHLWYFDARTMSLLLRQQGFASIELGRDVHRYPPRWLVRRAAHYFPALGPACRATERLLPGRLLDGFALPAHWGSLAAWATRPIGEPSSR